MYVLAKMTGQRALIAVMTDGQLHVFHKWELAFQTKNNFKKAEARNKFTVKVLAAKLRRIMCARHC